MQVINGLPTGVVKMTRSALLIVAIVGISFVASEAYGQNGPALQAPPASNGLQGLLPGDPPGPLLDTLDEFPESWKTWIDSTVEELNAFYRETPAEIAGQRSSLARLKLRLLAVDQALADSQYSAIRGQLLDLQGALIKRIDIAEAVLDTLTQPATQNSTATARQGLLDSLTSLETFLNGAIGGPNWKPFLRTEEVRNAFLLGSQSNSDTNRALMALQESLRRLQIAQNAANPEVRALCQIPVMQAYDFGLERAIAALERDRDGISWNDTRTELKRLIAELEKYEKNRLLTSADQVRAAYDRLRILAPDGADRLTWALRQHYFNSNFQASFSEGFLNRLMATTRVNSGGVRDFILGADVYGSQTTTSQSMVDLLPGETGARFQIQLTGAVANDTDAYASKATIHTVGNHQFQGFKEVYFDGTSFTTSPAMLNISASNFPVAASTKADGIPIFGGIARRIALRTANRNRPESEAIAADRVDSKVSPQFNQEVDSAFAELNAKLRDKVAAPLQSEQLYPDYIVARSTDSAITLNTRLMSGRRLGGGTAPVGVVGPDDVLFQFHESLLNNALDGLPIAGRSMTEVEFEQLVDQKLRKFFPGLKPAKQSKPQPTSKLEEPKRIIFAESDPLRVKFENGSMILVLRAGFERHAEQAENIPPQVVTIPWTVALVGEEIVMTRGEMTVEPLTASENIAQQLLVAGVIKSRLTKSFPDTSKASRTFDIERAGKSPILLQVTGMTMQNAWMSVRAVAISSPATEVRYE